MGASLYFRDADAPLTPQRLEVSAGPRMDPAFRVHWAGERLVLKTRDGRRTEAEPSEHQWAGFVRRLDELDAWSWEPSYASEEDIRDGYE